MLILQSSGAHTGHWTFRVTCPMTLLDLYSHVMSSGMSPIDTDDSTGAALQLNKSVSSTVVHKISRQTYWGHD